VFFFSLFERELIQLEEINQLNIYHYAKR